MATMLPTEPRDFDSRSCEDIVFAQLSKIPDKDYIIIHSMGIVGGETESDNREADFVIYHPEKGIMVLEVKNTGGVQYQNNKWLYGSGKEMSHDGPYRQALTASHFLLDKLANEYNENLARIAGFCQFTYAVWFIDVDEDRVKDLFKKNNMPVEASILRTLTYKELNDVNALKEKIDMIFDLDQNHPTNLSDLSKDLLFNHFLCPSFNITQSTKFINDEDTFIYNQFTKEQKSVLYLLEHTNTIAINGSAGTGKTVIAIEHAMILAKRQERVLFLCFNTKLYEYLRKKYVNNYITFYTATSFNNDYSSKMDSYIYDGKDFPFTHIIIDEGQDLGIKKDGSDVFDELLQNLADIVEADENKEKTISLFYDQFQLVNGGVELPSLIKNAECKFPLSRNCRNTTSIALSSLNLLHSVQNQNEENERVIGKKIQNVKGYKEGVPPQILFMPKKSQKEDIINSIARILKSWEKDPEIGKKAKVAILSCMSKDSGKFIEEQNKGYIVVNDKRCDFANCSTYKGLEADGVILVDMLESSISKPEYALTCYVGASRAKCRLAFIMETNDIECKELLGNCFKKQNIRDGVDPKRLLARELACDVF